MDTFESAIDTLGCIAEELGSLAQSSAEAVAKRLLSESMDRLTIVAKDVSNLAAETAIDLALIETKRIQIDRAQAENWVLLRELTEQAQSLNQASETTRLRSHRDRNPMNGNSRPGEESAISSPMCFNSSGAWTR
ncbi:MAG: hypothetical protein WBG11_07250 [Methylocella sp.]